MSGLMSAANVTPSNPYYRCSGPNCGVLKGSSDRWWIMWASMEDGLPVLHVAPWNEQLAIKEGALHVCGEGCAQKLQSQFMENVRPRKVVSHG
jgi:hypothetical protein